MDQTATEEICSRYGKLYSGVIADMLDALGCRDQVLPHTVTPFTVVDRLVGLAFTGQGYPAASPQNDDTEMRLNMLEAITPHTVSVWACGGHTEAAHWGEIMSTAARARGCVGAVVDGGVRDVDFINEMHFPVFASFKCTASSIGRWDITAFQVPIKIGRTTIQPGDLVFGDTDGVVIVPQDLILEVLVRAEAKQASETKMRADLRAGLPIKDAYRMHGAF